MSLSLNPLLYQVNTRVWLREISETLNRPATLDDIPDDELSKFAKHGFEWIWFLSVWQTGEVGKQISRTNPEWVNEFHETLPDLKDEDIPGSGFAITNYVVHEQLGGDARMQEMQDKGLNPYLRGDPLEKVQELKWYQEFEGLGGVDTYSRLGGLQSAELSMSDRIERMRELVELARQV